MEKPTCTRGKIHLYKWVLDKHKWILEKHKWVLSKTQVDIAPHEFFYFPLRDEAFELGQCWSELTGWGKAHLKVDGGGGQDISEGGLRGGQDTSEGD